MAIEQLLTPVTLAEHLGLKETTLRDWRWFKRGPKYLKIGSKVRYRMSDVEAWLESREVVPGGDK